MSRYPRTIASALFAFVTILSCPVSAQTTPRWSLDGPAFSAASDQLRSAAAAIHPEPFAETTVLFEQEKYALTADGKLTHTHQILYRIETKAGVEGWNEIAVQWDPWYQSQPSIQARVLSPEGHLSQLDPKTLTDVPAHNEQDETFSEARIRKAPLPAIAIGAIVEQETIVQDKLPFFSGGSVYRLFFARSIPVIRSRLILELPADLPIHTNLHEIPESAVSTTQLGSIRRLTYDLNAVPLSINSDIDLATDHIRNPFVEFSTGASWAAVASAYRSLAEPQIQPDHIRSILPPTLPPDYLQSIQAIVSRLHKEIRYTGIEFGESALRPQDPPEILKRHYGDCKDKAALLVAMLRASGIPAHLALLGTGPGIDVNPDLPGMNQFDHAIVYVPTGPKGQPALWIDATAEFTRVGDLPYADHGRLALIIAESTTALTRIPEAAPEQSTLIETRDFTLSQFGPAHIIETSATTGYLDSEYRYRYGSRESKATREDLEQYSRNAYRAKALTSITHSEGSDLTTPFHLTLDMAEAARGTSTLVEAAVAIPQGPLYLLPRWLSVDPDEGPKPTPEQLADRARAQLQRAPEYLIRPFIAEWHYRITLPAGFQPGTLPEDQNLSLGPATLTRHFHVENPQLVTAVIRLNTIKQRYTTEEVLALRKAVLELDRQNFTLLTFNQVGAKLIAEGKPRQAFAADQALIAAHPADAIHHVQFSAALLNLGLGEQAQAEARKATLLDPKSSIAFLQLGIALEHNNIGVLRERGFDRQGAIAAYRKAKLLDPENTELRTDLAVILEFNPTGDRYGEGSSLPEAIREYRDLEAIDKDAFQRNRDTLLYAMLYDHQYKPLLAELSTLPATPIRDAIGIAATAAAQSANAAIQRDSALSDDAQQKAAALRSAGFLLVNLNLYPQAADLLSASIQGQSDAAQVTRQVEIFRNLTHNPPASLTDARRPVQIMITSMMSDQKGQRINDLIPSILDRHAFASEAEWQRNLEQNTNDLLGVTAKQGQLPTAVMRDLILSNVKIASSGDDTHGYHVTLQTLGASPQNLFVTHDPGPDNIPYKIVASATDSAEVGNYAAYLLAAHRETEAHDLLDWKRDTVTRGGGDDPLEGNLFARFWTIGDEPTHTSYQLAILALIIQKPWVPGPVADQALAAAQAAAAKSPEDIDLNLLLASAQARRRDSSAEMPYLNKLLLKYPNSDTLIDMLGAAYDRTHNFAAWTALLQSRLAKRPTDRNLLLQSADEAQAESDFPRARFAIQKVIDSGKATANDYNTLAWSTLFDDHVDAAAIEAAQQSNTLSHNASFADIHTLACLYAASGKTAEARELLLKAMVAHYESEPNPEVWFGFGLIYEQYGLDEAAITAYKKVTPPDILPASPTDTYTLAQTHLKHLHAN